MNDRERFIACILGQPLDRPPYWLYWGPWGSTWRRWEREGKPPHITDHRTAFSPDVRPNAVPVNCGPCPRLEKTIIEESDDGEVRGVDGRSSSATTSRLHAKRCALDFAHWPR